MSTYSRFKRLIKKGPIIYDSYSGWEEHWQDTRSDGEGGRIHKRFKVRNRGQRSRLRQGPDWTRIFD